MSCSVSSSSTSSPMEAPLEVLIAATAGFLAVSAVLTLLVLICRHRPPSAAAKPAVPPPDSSSSSSSLPPSSPSSLRRISLPVLAAATRNFSPDAIIGDGSFGFVYSARLPSGATVAVKRLSSDASHGPRQFQAEMETLGRIRHPNLTRLLAYCSSGPDRLLIYDLLPNGSLDAWLHDRPSPGSLPWHVRLRVARGAAAGLAFLHHDCLPRIIHRDVKASNVLLDEGFEARIADFGLARLVESASGSHVWTQVAGTMGYMPPEYREGATAATVKGDVYSFGVVMLELATGRRASWPVGGEGMVGWARRMAEEGRGLEMRDEMMGDDGMVAEEFLGFLAAACRCTEFGARKRPEMREVVSMLDQL